VLLIVVISVALSLRIIIAAVVVAGGVILLRSMMRFRLRVSNDFFIHLGVHSASTLYRISELSLVTCADLR